MASDVDAIHSRGSVVWLALDGYPGASALTAVETSDPASRVVLSSTLTGPGTDPGSRTFEGGFAYIWGLEGYLEVYDLADARQPVLRSRTSVPAGWSRTLAHGGHLWATTSERIEVYDVRNPSAPTRVGGLLYGGLTLLDDPMVVCAGFGVIQTWSQAGISQTARLQVIDLNNPAQPVVLDSKDFTGDYGWSVPDSLSAIGDYLYYITMEADSWHLRAVRLGNLGKIEPTAVDLPFLRSDGNQGMWPVGDYLYISREPWFPTDPDYGKRCLRVIDVTQRSQPTEVAPQEVKTPLSFSGLTVQAGRVFFLCGGRSHALLELDAADPSHPVEVGTPWRDWGTQRRFYGLVEGTTEPTWRAADEGTSRFRLFRASSVFGGNPAAYRELSLPFDGSEIRHALVQGDYCYLLREKDPPDHSRWLDVFDLSNAVTPVHLGSQQVMAQSAVSDLSHDTAYHTVRISGETLFLSYASSLDLYSLANPGSPELASSVPIVYWPRALQVHNGYAYVFGDATSAGSARTLQVVDVRQPASPSPATTFRSYTDIGYGPMVAEQTSLYLVYDSGGTPTSTVLEVFDLTNPLNPARLSQTVVAVGERYTYDVAILRPYAFLGGWDGLLVVDLSDPALPRSLGHYAPFAQLQQNSPVNQVRAWQNHMVTQDDSWGIVVLDFVRSLSGLTLQPWWGNSARLTWDGAPGISLQRTTALPAPWDIVPNTDGRSEAVVSLGSPQAFFRLVKP